MHGARRLRLLSFVLPSVMFVLLLGVFGDEPFWQWDTHKGPVITTWVILFILGLIMHWIWDKKTDALWVSVIGGTIGLLAILVASIWINNSRAYEIESESVRADVMHDLPHGVTLAHMDHDQRVLRLNFFGECEANYAYERNSVGKIILSFTLPGTDISLFFPSNQVTMPEACEL